MHDVLGGMLQYEVKLLLKHMITVEKVFTLICLTRGKKILTLVVFNQKQTTAISQLTLDSDGNSLKQNGKVFLNSLLTFK